MRTKGLASVDFLERRARVDGRHYRHGRGHWWAIRHRSCISGCISFELRSDSGLRFGHIPTMLRARTCRSRVLHPHLQGPFPHQSHDSQRSTHTTWRLPRRPSSRRWCELILTPSCIWVSTELISAPILCNVQFRRATT